MILTREQAIKEHRKMWLWIAEQYRNGSKEYTYLLKRRYVCDLGICLKNCCFCCEYSFQNNRIDCGKCPIDFGRGEVSCERNRKSPYRKMIEQGFFLKMDNNYMADLAELVANLPEREEIL